jgi:hypothetical protein
MKTVADEYTIAKILNVRYSFKIADLGMPAALEHKRCEPIAEVKYVTHNSAFVTLKLIIKEVIQYGTY